MVIGIGDFKAKKIDQKSTSGSSQKNQDKIPRIFIYFTFEPHKVLYHETEIKAVYSDLS